MTASSEYGPDDTGSDDTNDQAPEVETADEYGPADTDPGPFDIPRPPDTPQNDDDAEAQA